MVASSPPALDLRWDQRTPTAVTKALQTGVDWQRKAVSLPPDIVCRSCCRFTSRCSGSFEAQVLGTLRKPLHDSAPGDRWGSRYFPRHRHPPSCPLRRQWLVHRRCRRLGGCYPINWPPVRSTWTRVRTIPFPSAVGWDTPPLRGAQAGGPTALGEGGGHARTRAWPDRGERGRVVQPRGSDHRGPSRWTVAVRPLLKSTRKV